MIQRKKSREIPEKTITSDDLLGKHVIDAEGRTIGITEKMFLDKETLEFTGIEVDRGLIKKGLQIGRAYIEKATEHAIFLNIRVAYEIRGMKVYDTKGELIGTVQDITLQGEKNQIKELHIKYKLLKKPFIIPSNLIQTIGKSVLLNTEKETLQMP